jgi:CheY-like chemotaxis protein
MDQLPKPGSPVVLVVDDDPCVRAVGADILADAGFEVLEACDAAEALAMLEAHPDIGVVFSDVEMPGPLDGVALASLVSERRPGVGIVLASGGREIDDVPCNGIFVRKPYAGAVLLRRIADVMRKVGSDTGVLRALSA